MSNLELWNKVCITDVKTTKNFKGKGGFQGTAVCAQSQRKKATELFGVYGIDWGVLDEKYDIVSLDESDYHYSKLFYTAKLYFHWKEKEGEFPIASEIDVFNYSVKYKSWTIGNDLYKKVRTDAMTKGLSELGFNADIFEGKFDDNKYVQDLKQEQNKQPSFNRQKEIDSISALVKTKTISDKDKEQIKNDIGKAKTKEDFDIIYANVEGL
jgi:hypothetical protein